MTNETFDENKIIEDCNKFLSKSDARFNIPVNRAVNDMERYSGDFWDKTFKKKYRRNKNRVCLSLNNWNVMCNAIASPVSNSPWHTELVDKTGMNAQVQEMIDQIESDNDSKSAMIDAFRKAVLTGYGYVVVTTVEDEITGEPKIVLESASHINSVAMDPGISTTDGSDAEEAAIVNYMPVKKARRLYGDDVVPYDYPRYQPAINLTMYKQWNVPQDMVGVVSYYVKQDNGFVHFYKIVGDKVVQDMELPIKIIPIIRFAGNEIYRDGNIDFNGIIQQTMSLELGMNIAYSTLVERVGRSPKGSYLINVDAIDGLEESYAKIGEDDQAAVLWKGEHQPVPIVETFQTGDLQATIQTCRTLLEDTMGIPLTGLDSTGKMPERTATEILRQQISKESNTANYYNNAFRACRSIAKILIQFVSGQDLKFTLENGPSVITRDMKIRQELTALSTIMPDNMKPLIAKWFADTLKDDLGEDLSRNIVANLPPDIRFVTANQDPSAVHALKSMQFTLDEALNELDLQKRSNDELRQQLNAAQLSLIDGREKRITDWNKFVISEQDKVALETAKLQSQNQKAEVDAIIDQEKVEIDAAEKQINSTKGQNDAYVQGMVDAIEQGA